VFYRKREVFTYLATSTPEGMHELKTKFADAFGKAGLSGKETAIIKAAGERTR
jgi:thiosulfate/3-mercaptopyruvate sulfurtransferase